jgi:hypothetical protein
LKPKKCELFKDQVEMALWKVAGALHRPNPMRVCSNRS